MPVARHPSFVFDCADHRRLAEFYGALLGWEVSVEEDWADIRPSDRSNCISFQPVEDYTPPVWPGQDLPQQLHLDVIVDDLDVAQSDVLALGATLAEHQPGTTFRVLLDPAGHPFCLCVQ